MGLLPKPTSLEFHTRLSPVECAAKLAGAIDVIGPFSIVSVGSRPALGRIKGNTFRLQKRIAYRNSFQTFLNGTFQPEGEGTLVRGQLALHPFTRVFVPIWFGLLAVIGPILFIGSLMKIISGHSSSGGNSLVGVLVPVVMAVFGVALVKFGRHLARDEDRFLESFIREVLEADERGAAAEVPKVKEI